MNPIITTFTGKDINPFDLNPAQVSITDIAHSLSMNCRFNGHVRFFYSVAEHCVHVSHLVPPKYALWGLLHDATEAYIPDMPSPLKAGIANFDSIEENIMRTIAYWFKLDWPMPDIVDIVDKKIVVDEAILLFDRPPSWAADRAPPAEFDDQLIARWYPALGLPCWEPSKARMKFLQRYHDLTGGCKVGAARAVERLIRTHF